MTKRRTRGDGALFQRHDHVTCPPLGPDGVRPEHDCKGMWVGRVDLGFRNGKRLRPTVYAKTKTAAQTKLKARVAEVEKGSTITASMPLQRWLATWLDEILPEKGTVRPRTLENYRSYVRQYLEPAIGRVRLDRLEPQHVRDLHRFVRDKGLSETTVGHAHRILSAALSDAMTEQVVFRNVVSLVPKPAQARSRRRSLTLPEVQRFFEVVHGERNASRWHAAFLMGLRQGEVLGLQRDRINLQTGILDISWQLQRVPWKHGCPTTLGRCGQEPAHCRRRVLGVLPNFEYRQLHGNLCLVRPKTSSSERILPIPEALAVSFREHSLATWDDPNPHNLMWTTPAGHPIDADDDRKQWRRILAAADIPHTDQHSARHTTSTLLLELGVPEDVRMQILGQSTAAANQLYSHAGIEIKRKALETLGSNLAL